MGFNALALSLVDLSASFVAITDSVFTFSFDYLSVSRNVVSAFAFRRCDQLPKKRPNILLIREDVTTCGKFNSRFFLLAMQVHYKG